MEKKYIKMLIQGKKRLIWNKVLKEDFLKKRVALKLIKHPSPVYTLVQVGSLVLTAKEAK